jgi:hypothetical protein
MRLGLVVEGEGRGPGTCVVEICLGLHIPFRTELDMQEQVLLKCVSPCPVPTSLNLCQGNVTPTVPGFRADMKETSATVVHVSFTHPGLAIPPSTLSSWHTCLIDPL